MHESSDVEDLGSGDEAVIPMNGNARKYSADTDQSSSTQVERVDNNNQNKVANNNTISQTNNHKQTDSSITKNRTSESSVKNSQMCVIL